MRVDGVGERVEPRQHGEPAGQAAEREQRAGEEEHRQHEQLHEAMNDCDLLDPRRDHHAERGEREREQQQLDRAAISEQHGVVGHVARAPASASITTPWSVATVAPPRHLPSTIEPRRTGATSISRRKPNSRSHTIEPAEKIAVNSTDIARTPGNMNVRKLTPPSVAGDQRREPGAEHEQEQQRLHERGDDPQAVAAEADQLAVPDDAHGAQVARAACRAATGRATTCASARRRSSRHRRRRRIMASASPAAGRRRPRRRGSCGRCRT